jgi:hypothetical protein
MKKGKSAKINPQALVENPKLYKAVRTDPRQESIYGPGHADELKDFHSRPAPKKPRQKQEPRVPDPNQLSFQSALLHRQAGIISMLDLDAYDSELTQDLLALHDEIAMNPVRGYSPDYRSPHAQKRVWNFTWNSLQNRLMPAIARAVPQISAKAQTGVRAQLDGAVREMTLAQSALDREENYSHAGAKLEGAFSLLHDAIEIIRNDTRKVPAARNIRPPVPQAYRDFS